MGEKIDELNTTLAGKDKELTLVKQKLEHTVEELERKKQLIEDSKSDQTNEKGKFQSKIENLRNEN